MGDEDNRESNGGGNQPFDPFASFMAHVEGQVRELTQHIRIVDKRVSDLDALLTQRTSTLADFLKRETRDRVSDIAAASTRVTRVESDVKTLVDDLALRFESIGNMVDARLTAQSAEVKKVKDDLSQFKVQVVLDQRNANTVLTAGRNSAPVPPIQPQPQPTQSQPQHSQSQPQPSQQFSKRAR